MSAEGRIKQYLAENGISQTYVSKKAGIPLSKLSLSLNGKRKMTLEEYAIVCKALGVNAERFLEP